MTDKQGGVEMTPMTFTCPGCNQQKTVFPGGAYKVCERCGRPHCAHENGPCKTGNCTGWLKNETR